MRTATDDMDDHEDAAPSEEILRRLVSALNRRDLDTVMSFFANDCVFETPRGRRPWGRRLHGIENVREAFAAQIGRIPDARYVEDEHLVCGNHGCSEWTLIGTKPNGEAVEFRGCDVWEFREGKIVRRSSYWKFLGERSPGLAQPPPAAGPIYS
ncbi:MAG TPA: nuclear transport factor 2 family protein [Actinomycetota bacterium]|nr:nuclear transport factor 2 family protein [Actinomycetota bacterium]